MTSSTKKFTRAERRCYVDDGLTGDEHCVFDEGAASECDEAVGLAAQGLCKKDCQHWRLPESVAESHERAISRVKTKSLIRIEANLYRDDATSKNFKLATSAAAVAPEFHGDFGHGAYYRHDE